MSNRSGARRSRNEQDKKRGIELKERLLFSWSGGKDSAMALYEITRADSCKVAALLTTITEGYDRISLHGVRRTLVEQQVRLLGHPASRKSSSPRTPRTRTTTRR